MGKVSLLPIGSIEQHGVLPLDTDTIIAQAFCELAVVSGLNVAVELPVTEGFCPTTCDLTGTKVFRFSEVLNRVDRSLRQIVEQGRRYIILVNIHGGNDTVLKAIVQNIYVEQRFPVFYFNPYTAFADELNQVCFPDCDNSCKECSLLLAGLDILGKEPVSGPSADEEIVRNPLIENLKKVGTLGFSYQEPAQHIAWRSGATAKAGRNYLEETVKRFGSIMENFKQYVENELAKKR
ncbi:creatininase family protein [bacterium]|nr:creatininase family protein [bacterium]